MGLTFFWKLIKPYSTTKPEFYFLQTSRQNVILQVADWRDGLSIVDAKRSLLSPTCELVLARKLTKD